MLRVIQRQLAGGSRWPEALGREALESGTTAFRRLMGGHAAAARTAKPDLARLSPQTGRLVVEEAVAELRARALLRQFLASRPPLGREAAATAAVEKGRLLGGRVFTPLALRGVGRHATRLPEKTQQAAHPVQATATRPVPARSPTEGKVTPIGDTVKVVEVLRAESVKRKRRSKMNKHKHRKRKKKAKFKKRKV